MATSSVVRVIAVGLRRSISAAFVRLDSGGLDFAEKLVVWIVVVPRTRGGKFNVRRGCKAIFSDSRHPLPPGLQFLKGPVEAPYFLPYQHVMYKWHVNSAIGRGRPIANDFSRVADGIAASLRQFSVSTKRAEDGGTFYR